MADRLVFWCEAGEGALDPRAVRTALLAGQPVAGLAPFPMRRFLREMDTLLAGYPREVFHPRFRAYRLSERAVIEMAWDDRHVTVSLAPPDAERGAQIAALARSVGVRTDSADTEPSRPATTPPDPIT